MNHELPDVQDGFRKGQGTRDQIVNICWIIEKVRVPEKHLLLFNWLCQNLWLCGSQQTGKFLKRWEYQITWPASWEICVQVKKQQLELDMEQQTGSKSEPWFGTLTVYCHPAYLTYMQSTSCKMLGWMKHKLKSRLLEEINNLRYAIDTTLLAESKEELKSLLMKEESGKSWLKTQPSKIKIMASGPITSCHIDGETMEIVSNFILQNHCRWWL